MPYEQASSTKCKICGQNFVGPVVIVGAAPTARVVEYVNKLRAHLAEKHPNEYAACDLHATQFLTGLALMHFRTNDQQLAFQIDFLRWQVHQKTLLARIPDDKLKARVDELAADLASQCNTTVTEFVDDLQKVDMDGMVKFLTECFTAKLYETFKGLRELLEEPNKYPESKVTPAGNGRILTPR